MSRAKRRRAARAGADYEQQRRYRELLEQLRALPHGERPDWFSKQDVFGRVWRPTPTDPDELKRLASVCRSCGEEGHHRRSCPKRLCFTCGEPGHVAEDCNAGAGS